MLTLAISDPTTLLTLYWVVVTVIVIGVIGAIVPAIPGLGLITIAILIWAVIQGFTTSTVIPLIVSAVLLVLSLGIDFLATYYGAKQAGASKWGQIGAFVGLFLGLFGFLPTLPIGGPLGPIFGVIIGSVIGALVGEFLYRKNLWIAIKAAIGIVVGTVIGKLIQGILALATLVVFLFNTWPYKGG